MDNVRPIRPGIVTLPQTKAATKSQAKKAWLETELLVVVGLMVVTLLAHGLNMFHYPSYTFLDDEGIYTQQAWAVLTMHKMSYYTYFYDHSPGGWLLLAAWMGITGGPNTFGNAVDSGRVLMLLLNLASVPLVYQLARKLGGNTIVAFLATLLFALSPLSIFYQRMVLLDNIMVFWVLVSLNLLLDGWGRLSRMILSGICFGLALISKETAFFLLPAVLYLVFQQRWKHQGRFSIIGWILPVGAVVSWYVLYAGLKSEIFPKESVIDIIANSNASSPPGVSLVGSLLWQLHRGGGGMFNLNNQFWYYLGTDWLLRDPVLLIGGGIAVLINLVRGLRDRRLLAASLFGLCTMYYLARGGVVMNYYVLFAIPFLALNFALAIGWGLGKIPVKVAALATAAVVAVLGIGYLLLGAMQPLFTEHPDEAGREATAWIKANVPADSYIIGRDDMWTDMHQASALGPAFPNYHTHWKVGLDPAIRNDVFHNDWQTVDYLVTSPNMDENAFKQSNDTVAMDALAHAHLVKTWSSALGDTALQPHQIIQLWKVDKTGAIGNDILQSSTSYLNQHFDHNGAYVNPDGTTDSQSEANALLRDVWTGDKTNFYQTWNWTKQYLVNPSGLLSRIWPSNVSDAMNSSSAADSDTALALLLASKQWNDTSLQQAAQKLIGSIWDNEVVTVSGKPYVAAGNWAAKAQPIVINPGYFAPYAYRVFAQVDTSHDWNAVVTNGYAMLTNASTALLGSEKAAGLPPDWVGLDTTSGQFVPLNVANTDTTVYGYQAPATYWRVALDALWSNSSEAKQFLTRSNFFKNDVNQLLADGITYKHHISAVYKHDGAVAEETPSMLGTTGAIAQLLNYDAASANILYAGQIIGSVNHNNQGDYWGSADDLQAQEWGWFATALYNKAIPNIWSGK